MTISINSTRTLITIASTVLDNFVAAPATYTDIVITGKYLSNDEVSHTFSNTVPITTTTVVASDGAIETILPTFFGDGNTEFSNGIYQFEIKLTGTSSIDGDVGCLFVDVDTDGDCVGPLKRKIYSLDSDVDDRYQKISDYFILANIGDCQCKCEDAVTIYNCLNNQLDNNCLTC